MKLWLKLDMSAFAFDDSNVRSVSALCTPKYKYPIGKNDSHRPTIHTLEACLPSLNLIKSLEGNFSNKICSP